MQDLGDQYPIDSNAVSERITTHCAISDPILFEFFGITFLPLDFDYFFENTAPIMIIIFWFQHNFASKLE